MENDVGDTIERKSWALFLPKGRSTLSSPASKPKVRTRDDSSWSKQTFVCHIFKHETEGCNRLEEEKKKNPVKRRKTLHIRQNRQIKKRVERYRLNWTISWASFSPLFFLSHNRFVWMQFECYCWRRCSCWKKLHSSSVQETTLLLERKTLDIEQSGSNFSH